jgi:FdrA protein
LVDVVTVSRGVYHDSVTLMLASNAASAKAGAQHVTVAMATPLNLGLIAAQGFKLADTGELSVNDLVIAVRADDQPAADLILAAVDDQLSGRGGQGPAPRSERAAVSIRSAARRRPELSLALVSVPGRHAAYEAAEALDAGLHVLCFSDGVSARHERVLKSRAAERGLMFMGPDCGTAIIDGIGLGFSNAVRRGPVGIVGASGTGIQEVCCLLDCAGVGISQAIGVGGRDVSAEIGGVMMRRGLELLAADAGTEVIVAISKPPDRAVAGTVLDGAEATGKPAVVAFLGLDRSLPTGGGVELVDRLELAAGRAAALAGFEFTDPDTELRRPSGFVRGLFSGGTLCLEAMLVLAPVLGRLNSNVPLKPEWRLSRLDRSEGHTLIDFGADELTDGRPHPMIDPALRLERLAREAADPDVSVILLDIVLGYGAHPDPAAVFAPAIAQARAARDDLSVVVALCGTAQDPQNIDLQRARLADAGAVALRGAAAAARTAISTAIRNGGERRG